MTPHKTAFYDQHVAMGAHLVEFAHTLLPVRFHSEVLEHQCVRHAVGIFDVSHMGEFIVAGKNACGFLQQLLTNNVERLSVGQAQYSLMLNRNGGIVDDIIVYHLKANLFLLCVNAANIEKDWQHVINESKHNDPCEIKNVSDVYAQLAIQGPKSAALLASITQDSLPERYWVKHLAFAGIDCIVARTGYTGEDGFEIFVKNDDARELYDFILVHGKQFGLMPCGLAARDSLRLEAGLLLYGNDMDEETMPKEVGLSFALDLNKPDFVGKKKIMGERATKNKLVGFRILDKGIARHGFRVFDSDLNDIGKVTSATYLPDKKIAIGFALLKEEEAACGRAIRIDIRGRFVNAEICSTRFLSKS